MRLFGIIAAAFVTTNTGVPNASEYTTDSTVSPHQQQLKQTQQLLLTPDTFADLTANRNHIFVRFTEPRCMDSTGWNEFLKKYHNHPNLLVVDCDCSTPSGKVICEAAGIKHCPTFMYGNPTFLQKYHGGWKLEHLEDFASSEQLTGLDVSSSDELIPKDVALEQFSKMSRDELDTVLAEYEMDEQRIENLFETWMDKDDMDEEKKWIYRKVFDICIEAREAVEWLVTWRQEELNTFLQDIVKEDKESIQEVQTKYNNLMQQDTPDMMEIAHLIKKMNWIVETSDRELFEMIMNDKPKIERLLQLMDTEKGNIKLEPYEDDMLLHYKVDWYAMSLSEETLKMKQAKQNHKWFLHSLQWLKTNPTRNDGKQQEKELKVGRNSGSSSQLAP